MKTVDEYLQMPYRMEIIPDAEEGGFVITFPDLPGCISIGDTIEEAYANAQDAKKAWLDAALDSGIIINEPNNINEYSGQFKLRIPKTLHKLLAEHAKKEGISMNQYCLFLLSRNDAKHFQ